MLFLQAIILSVIEGITEFLPVSSTGHLILAGKLMGIQDTEFTKSFDLFIQLGAIMAIVSLYAGRIIKNPSLVRPILIAFLPTALVGLVFYSAIKSYLLGNDTVVVYSLAGVGLLMILLETYWIRFLPRTYQSVASLSARQLLTIGVFQAVSVIPGVSRAAATIIGGMISGLSRKEAVEFSFLLAVPTMAAATGLDLAKSARAYGTTELSLLLTGFVVSWAVAVLTVRIFIRLVSGAAFTAFGYYRIAIAALYFLLRGI